MSELPPFSKREVAIVMTGTEWVALLARLLQQPLSEKGERVFKRAAEKMSEQLAKAGGVSDG